MTGSQACGAGREGAQTRRRRVARRHAGGGHRPLRGVAIAGSEMTGWRCAGVGVHLGKGDSAVGEVVERKELLLLCWGPHPARQLAGCCASVLEADTERRGGDSTEACGVLHLMLPSVVLDADIFVHRVLYLEI